jgi:TolB-like protein
VACCFPRAASVRHPNVASVFHLGEIGGDYFYAMEFVDGETLEGLIKCSGRLEVTLALEIATQVAAGLAAVHKQNLVHRDIKPSNIMVSLEGEGAVTAKIIDLGLAKSVNEPSSPTAISTPGAFAGTPEFASPEQFAGVGVDIRSDLYSLGVTLWNMLAGQHPFRGTSGELMHQHLHAGLPIGQLDRLPQPVVALIELLLEKDPARRFQNPDELLRALPSVTRAIEAKRTVKHQNLRVTFVRQNELPARRAPKRSVAVLPFDTLSRGQRNTYFADGVHDEILSSLAKIAQLKVISRTSVMTYRPGAKRDLRSLARILRVANVVEGTVRRDGNRVRITIRLVDARNDNTIWADSYDRDLTDIFAIQSEVAQTIANKLTATLSPQEKQRIEAKPTDNLEAYDLYLRAKGWIEHAKIYPLVTGYEKPLRDAIDLLDQAVQLDPKFTLAYCAAAFANDWLYRAYDPTPDRRSLGDIAVNNALRLQPDLPEAHFAYATHLYIGYRDYERARVQLAIARRSMPNNTEAMVLQAFMDRRQGSFEKAIQELKAAITLDPRNPMTQLPNSLFMARQFSAAEEAYDRAIDLAPDHPILKVLKAYYVTSLKTGEDTAVRSALAALPASMAEDRDVVTWRLVCALCDRDWDQAIGLVQELKGGDDEGGFAYMQVPVPAGCYLILIARMQGHQTSDNSGFAETREQLNKRIHESQADGKARLLTGLAVVDALLGNKQDATAEGKRAVDMLPLSKDAVDGPSVLANLALVYAWTGEPDLAFETLNSLAKTPNGIYYGNLKLDPMWDPLRKDPRFDKLLTELAPKD